ncbi:Serine/threonine protein kinase PrkC, regulator of stationary phase [Labilithrix luteola]|uniref:Serine/threonine protein kinase PrkC, regulator of stationary phase n=1 Tax=Labilithrix luteola TaxID=1391654 RepID=A0A0K1QED9_9BACT|nr:serine/threonine-protein kinase [Labilithrix luteola]AKV03780.1 Serine/threonine protein kinase PrkC, regulator of stationary phase [Labilithrix luteola]
MGDQPVVTRLGRYRLIAELGRGGMANVFLAVTEGAGGVQFNKLVVIKRLREHVAEDPEFVTMLIDEGRIAARLNHPNVVQTLEVGREGGELFLAMEYLDGQALHRILTRGRETFPLAMHLAVLTDVLVGIHDAHELKDFDGTPLNIVHRDVTPHNVFVTYNGQVKVVDFGIAKAEGRASETRSGTVKGKILYMAPEQARSLVLDRRADIFSVGVMLYEACIRGRMWQGMADADVVRALQNRTFPRSPRELAPDTHPELDRICRRALAAERTERYETAEEFAADLDAFMSAHLPRPSNRELGAWLSTLYQDRREVTRKLIEAQLADLKREAEDVTIVSVAEPIDVTGEEATDGTTQVLSPRKSPNDAAAEGDNSDSATPRRINRLRVGLFASAAVAAAAVIGVSAATRVHRPFTEPPPASDAGATDVTLIIRALPHETRFTIDEGGPVENPYIGKVKRDGTEHRITATAPGFEPRSQTVKFTDDVSLRFTLGRATPDAGHGP